MSSGDAGESFAAGVPPAWSVTALIIAFCVGSLVVFSVLVSFPRSEAVRGALRYTGAESKLLAETNGYVSAVFVKNGHSISQGEPILEISTERFLSTTTELNQTAIDLLEDERIGLQEQKEAIKASAELEITNVELEHSDYLGTTLNETAAEKAGIIKSGFPEREAALFHG